MMGIITLLFISAVQFFGVPLILFAKIPGASSGAVSFVGTLMVFAHPIPWIEGFARGHLINVNK